MYQEPSAMERRARDLAHAKSHVKADEKLAKLPRVQRRGYVRSMLDGAAFGRRPGRAPRRTGQPAHVVRWRREAAEARARTEAGQ